MCEIDPLDEYERAGYLEGSPGPPPRWAMRAAIEWALAQDLIAIRRRIDRLTQAGERLRRRE